MKFSALTITLLCTVIFSVNTFSQTNQNKYFRQDLLPIFDSLIHPPENCETAFSNTLYDSVRNEFEIAGKLKAQYDFILSLHNEYESESQKADKKKIIIHEGPGRNDAPENGPPQGGFGPPGGLSNIPDGAADIMEDLNNANLILDNIVVNTEKYKSELKKSVSKLKDELRSTLQNDYQGRLKLTNDFLSLQLTDYNKYYLIFKTNMSKVNEIVKKYNNEEDLKFHPAKEGILRIQTVMIDNIKFLITITKEFSLAGAKFYSEEKANRN